MKSLKEYQKAKSHRALYEDLFQDCFDYALPARQGFYDESPGQRRDELIFDETAVVGTQEFASRLQGGMVPNFARWSELECGSDVPEEQRQQINAQLEPVTDYVFEVIHQSNFGQQVHESFMDLAVGTGTLRVDEGDSISPVVFSAIPLPKLVLCEGPDGSVGKTYFVREKVKYSDIEFLYRDPKFPEHIAHKASKDETCTIIECSERDFSARNEQKFKLSATILEDEAEVWSETVTGIGSNPLITFRWGLAAGEVYGRGPLVHALSAIKTTNDVVRMTLENAQMAISGMYQMEDDGVINPSNIVIAPGTIVPIGPGSRGLMNVNSSGRFDVSQLILQDQRLNIKRALYNDMLGDPDRTPATATEIAERMADLSRRMGSAFARLQVELVQPVLQRVIYIMKKRGLIDLPSVNGREVKIRATSPLAQAQANEDVASIARWLQLVGGTYGPEVVNLLTDSNEVAIYLGQKFGVPENLIRDEEQRKQLLALMQQAMAERGQISTGPDQNINPGAQVVS